MRVKISEIIKIYFIEIVAGALILIFLDIKWFLFYFLIIFFINTIQMGDALRKFIKVYSLANESKLLAIMKKLNITEEEAEKTADETTDKMTKEQQDKLSEEIKDVLRFG